MSIGQPIGICVEFDSVVYIYDAQSNSLKIITPFSETGRFLRAAVHKYRLGVCKMKKSKILKLCQIIGLGKLFLEK